MQNRYVGDVGDFGKYALLRKLCGPDTSRPVRLCVVWCLFPDEQFGNDGKHVSYLGNPTFAQLDAELHAALASIVSAARRNISSIRECGLLPSTTRFFAEPISTSDIIAADRRERVRQRDAWLRACLRYTAACELVFFDPDNGLEIASVPKHHPRAGKYVYWEELARFWQRGNSLLVYHHLNRTAAAAQQVRELTSRFTTEFRGAVVVPLVFRRGSSRVFWLIHHGDDLGLELERRAADLLSSEWSQHFRPFGWPDRDQTETVAR